MKSTGKIDEVTVPASLVASLKQSGTTGNALDEATLKQLMTQSAITLPENPIKPERFWDSVQQVEMPFGTVIVKSKLTYQGIDASTGHAKIGMVPSIIGHSEARDRTVDLTLTKTEGTGQCFVRCCTWSHCKIRPESDNADENEVIWSGDRSDDSTENIHDTGQLTQTSSESNSNATPWRFSSFLFLIWKFEILSF